MNDFKKILVATDFSTTADEAVRRAAALAARYDATLVIAHVAQAPTFLVPAAYLEYARKLFDESSGSLGKLLERAAKEARAVGAKRVRTELVQGLPAPELVGLAQAENCDLIVIGTHGRTGVQHAIMGSVAERVVRGATCAVMTIRPQDKAAA